MKRITLAVLLLAAASCGDDDGGSSTPDAGATLDTPAKIFSFLDGKTIKMTGADIPSHPNGYNEDTNFGAATQCYLSVQIATAAGNFTVTSALGTLEGAPTTGTTGTCNHALQNGNPLTFPSTTVLIENVKPNGECFDITATYPGFVQEGRGKISPDGKKVTLELFFTTQATGHRCAAGAVGAATVTLNGQPFAGNAQQVYTVQ